MRQNRGNGSAGVGDGLLMPGGVPGLVAGPGGYGLRQRVGVLRYGLCVLPLPPDRPVGKRRDGRWNDPICLAPDRQLLMVGVLFPWVLWLPIPTHIYLYITHGAGLCCVVL